MRFRLPFALALVGLLSGVRPVHGDPLTFSFFVDPAGSITGVAGDTIGWGYGLVNDTDAWLEISGIDAGTFEHGVADASVFDFPILEPHTSLTVPFASLTSGLFQLTWDADAPAGFANSGVFVLSANFWDGDPFNGGNFVTIADNQSSEYAASVDQVSVPEPATSLLVGAGIALAALRRRRSRRPVRPLVMLFQRDGRRPNTQFSRR